MPTGYSRQQIVLHWAIFALVALQFLLHEGIAEAFEAVEDGLAPQADILTNLHIFGGFLVFVLMLWRLMLRLTRGAPPPPEAEPAPFRLAGHAAHWVFYALLILLPVTGAVAWYRQSEAAGEVHEALRGLLFLLILAHIGAVAVHQFVWKTGLMDRMRRADT